MIRVNEFNDVATTPIEEWLDYLKNDHTKEGTTVPGLQEARQKLTYLRMSPEDRRSYDRHVDNMMIQNDVVDTVREEGMAQGRHDAMLEMARKLLSENININIILSATGLSKEEMDNLM